MVSYFFVFFYITPEGCTLLWFELYVLCLVKAYVLLIPYLIYKYDSITQKQLIIAMFIPILPLNMVFFSLLELFNCDIFSFVISLVPHFPTEHVVYFTGAHTGHFCSHSPLESGIFVGDLNKTLPALMDKSYLTASDLNISGEAPVSEQTYKRVSYSDDERPAPVYDKSPTHIDGQYPGFLGLLFKCKNT